MDLSLNNSLMTALISAGLTLVLLLWYVYRSQVRIEDSANQRSSHQGQVLTGAGIFMFVPFCLFGIYSYPLFLPLYLILLLSIIGMLDDRYDLSFKWRLVIQVGCVLALLVFIELEVPWWWLLLLAFAMLWWVNLFNFMDGANGLAGVHALCSISLYAWLFNQKFSHQSVFDFIGIAAVLLIVVYLVFNMWLKKLFMGDSGSLPMALLVGTLALYGIHYGIFTYLQVAIIHAVFIVDATMTLVHRLINRENLTQAHNTHLYQRLIKVGWSHGKVALVYGLITVLGCALVYFLSANETAILMYFVLVYVALLIIFMKTLALGRKIAT